MSTTFPSLKELFSHAWDSFTKKWMLLWGAVIIIALFSIAFELLEKSLKDDAFFILFLIWGGSIIIFSILGAGFYRLALNAISGRGEIKDLWSEHRKAFSYFLVSLLQGIIILAGFVLLIIPGIIFALMFGQSLYALIDKNKGVLESLSYSAKITKGYRWKILGIGIVLFFLILVSIIPFGLGLLITIPLSITLSAHLYRILSDIYEEKMSESEGREENKVQ